MFYEHIKLIKFFLNEYLYTISNKMEDLIDLACIILQISRDSIENLENDVFYSNEYLDDLENDVFID